MFSLIIAGTRTFSDYALLKEECDKLLADVKDTNSIVILSGAAKGADILGEQYAEERGFDLQRFPADWKNYAKAAGPIRNSLMAKRADGLIAFWDGKSKGTKDMIEKADKTGIYVKTILITD